MVYDRLILGSSGNEPPPTDADAEVFFAKEWRWLETRDRNWAHMTPIQGDWTISSIGLPAVGAAQDLFRQRPQAAGPLAAPARPAGARRISQDFDLDGGLERPALADGPSRSGSNKSARDGAARPELSTTVRALWSAKYLYLACECPFTKLTVFDPPQSDRKRFDLRPGQGVSLWDRDVVEAFIGADPEKPRPLRRIRGRAHQRAARPAGPRARAEGLCLEQPVPIGGRRGSQGQGLDLRDAHSARRP